MKEKWFLMMKKADFQAVAEKFHISPVIARLLRNRDVMGDEAIDLYLNGTIADLFDGMLMKDMDKAVDILAEKIREDKTIRVIGDYDIDGVNATYILKAGLTGLGARADTDIPDRILDGYGLNRHLIERAAAEGIDTIVTCDNGIAAADEIAYGKKLGLTILVTDHHEVPFTETPNGRVYRLPPADAVVDPRQPGCPYPFKDLCGAAVAYKLMEALYEATGHDPDEIDSLMENVAIATVGDIMALTGENRIFVRQGLEMLKRTANQGLKALMERTGILTERLNAYHIGFILGPCINAGGRLDTAKRALALLEAETYQEAVTLAEDLKALNDTRKEMTEKGTEEAARLIDTTPLGEDRVLVVYLPDCHESIAGIIAGRIRDRYYRPAFILTDAKDGVKGSGRSIDGYDMFAGLCGCQELLTRFGGHKAAAGLSLAEENVERFREAVNAGCDLTEEDLTRKVQIDMEYPLQYLTEEVIGQIGLLEPFGKGNPKPLFAERNLKVLDPRIVGRQKNVLRFQVQNKAGIRMDAVRFGDARECLSYIRSKPEISITFRPEINEYMGRRSIQLRVENYQ